MNKRIQGDDMINTIGSETTINPLISGLSHTKNSYLKSGIGFFVIPKFAS